jgi:hypothetical protein
MPRDALAIGGAFGGTAEVPGGAPGVLGPISLGADEPGAAAQPSWTYSVRVPSASVTARACPAAPYSYSREPAGEVSRTSPPQPIFNEIATPADSAGVGSGLSTTNSITVVATGLQT